MDYWITCYRVLLIMAAILGTSLSSSASSPHHHGTTRRSSRFIKDQILDYIIQGFNSSSCGSPDNVGGVRLHPRLPVFRGYKSLCLDPSLAPMEAGKCSVYSLDDDEDSTRSFHDAMEKLHGCGIHSFNTSDDLVKGLTRNSRSSPTVSYLSLDVEDMVVQRVLLEKLLRSGLMSNSVRQLNVQIHFDPELDEDVKNLWDLLETFKSLDRAGMVRFDSVYDEFHEWRTKSNDIPALGSSSSRRSYQMAWYNSHLAARRS